MARRHQLESSALGRFSTMDRPPSWLPSRQCPPQPGGGYCWDFWQRRSCPSSWTSYKVNDMLCNSLKSQLQALSGLWVTAAEGTFQDRSERNKIWDYCRITLSISSFSVHLFIIRVFGILFSGFLNSTFSIFEYYLSGFHVLRILKGHKSSSE